ncbi:MAG TPA: AAA family ATPase [Ktedonobacteraceae bacterium]|nr:AAA family ATPase [Ktedonobacteraceae bacterium]
MTMGPSNPYYNMAAVRDPQMFYGRSRLLNTLFSALTNRQCISLVGARGIGKSSVLQYMKLAEVQQQFGFDARQYILVLIDLREYLRKSADDFFDTVSKHIVAQCLGRLTVKLPEEEGVDQFSNVIDQVADQGYHIVLLMDAFDNITRNDNFDPEFFSFLRAWATMGKVSYVTASIAPLYEVCHRGIKDSPFFNIFATSRVEPLTLEEAQSLVQEPAQRVGSPFSASEMEWVVSLAGRHPYFIQRVCWVLFEEKYAQGNVVVDRGSVQKRAYEELLSLFNHMWERLDDRQSQLLRDEARREDNQRREMPELSESALFRAFVREKCNIQLFQMTVDEIEKVLDRIEDTRFLGESDLRFMKVVATRIKTMATPSLVERGIAIREVLNAALEQLRGAGPRRDAASDWRLYNILYYRYFKYQLKNEQISARLQFTSIRQYYRERSKALEAFLNALFEMEAAANSVVRTL